MKTDALILGCELDGLVAALRLLERGKSVYISGRLYRWLDPFFQSVWTRRLFKISAAHSVPRTVE